MGRIELVSTASRLAEVVDALSKAPRVAVDLESNGFFRYHERVCLVQLSAGDTAFLADPLEIDDMGPLGDLLRDESVEKVFHAADYDIRSLDRDWGFRVAGLFDTGIAAAFVGSSQLGLQSVVEQQIGLVLAKPRKLQRSDWSLRPLGPEALSYAADDVLHLPQVREALSSRLEELGRFGWVKEEFARLENVRHTPADREQAYLSIKGGRGLNGKGLAILRSLFRFREREASRRDRPPFKVMPDSALIELATEPAADLSKVKGLGRFGRRPANRGIRAAIEEGRKSAPVTRPKRARTGEALSPAERKRAEARLKVFKTWRKELGLKLRLDPALLWPAVSLERLARRPDTLDSELVSAEVRSWQGREFGESLRGILATLG